MLGKWWLARIMLNCVSAGLLAVSAMNYLRQNGRSEISQALGFMLYASVVEMLAVTVLIAVYPPTSFDNAWGFFARLIQVTGVFYFLRRLNPKVVSTRS